MSTHQEALDYPAGEWFSVADLTNGAEDTECWRRLCDAALSKFTRHSDQAQLMMNESRSRFRWQPKIHRGEVSLASVLRARSRR